MDIREIALKLNKRIEQSDLSNFQSERAKRLNLKKAHTAKFFSSATTHDGYAYHSGGRAELQFNISLESKNRFRYGIAISLQEDRYVKNPVEYMSGRIAALNNLIDLRPELFDGMEMWRFHNHLRSDNQPIGKIPQDWVKNKSFIFLGILAKVNESGKFSELLCDEVVEQFERLMPVYEFVESPDEVSERYRIARVTWNTNGWRRPSGPQGKVKNPKNFEYKTGFGHEEWLFDTDRLIDGWHYGFLQGLGYFYEKYQGRKFNMLIYSVNSATKERFWIGRVTNMECISPDLSKRAHEIYRRKGWLDEMVEEAIAAGTDGKHIRKEQDVSMINCRFRPANLQIFDDPRPQISVNDKYLKALYYDTLTKLPPKRFAAISAVPDDAPSPDIPDDLSPYGAAGIEKRQSKSWNQSGTGTRSDLRHKEWEKRLLVSLRAKYGTKNAGIGVRCGRGFADVAVIANRKRILIELKTAHSAQQVVREGLSQVIEYGYWPGRRRTNIRLAIAGTPKLDAQTEHYLEFLRDEMKLPVWYLRLDEDSGALVGLEEIIGEE